MRYLTRIILVVTILQIYLLVSAQIMSREEAAIIAHSVCDKLGLSNYSLKWATTDELPTPVEILPYDYDLQDILALAGYNPQPTLYPSMDSLPFVSTPFDEFNYIYWCGDYMIAVNAYSGRTLVKSTKLYNWQENDYILPKEQLMLIAQQFVQNFLKDKTWRWFICSIPNNSKDYAYFMATTFNYSFGVDLLEYVSITLDATNGKLVCLGVYQREVVIPIEPLLTCDEARQLAESALKSSFPNSELISHPENDHLLVFEDSALEQFLAWRFHFTVVYQTGGWLDVLIMVDAHTGEILWEGTLIPMGMEVLPQRRKRFKGNSIILNGKEIHFGKHLLLRNGRIYLWTGYLPFFKVKLQNNQMISIYKKLNLSRGDFVIFNGNKYVSLRIVCSVANIRLWWDNEKKVPILRAEWLEPRKLLAQRR